MEQPHPAEKRIDPIAAWCLIATFLVAVSGLIYELVAATASSYLLGDSVLQFSLVIGVFLASMGLGAWASRFVRDPLLGFIGAQASLAAVGAAIAPLAFIAFGYGHSPASPIYIGLVLVGALSGMEIPLLTRTLTDLKAGKFALENVLSADYLGALAASVAFPILLVPYLGLINAGLVFGGLNFVVATLSLWVFRDRLCGARMRKALRVVIFGGILLGMMIGAGPSLVAQADRNMFQDPIVYRETTPYQEIVITSGKGRTRLFLDRSIQFDSRDEAIYHETLVHPAMAMAPRRARVAILGGGDGMAIREVLRWKDVDEVFLVDIDKRLPEIFVQMPELAELNDRAFQDPRVKVLSEDAWRHLASPEGETYDVVILDLPDPKNLSIARLYSAEFYSLLRNRLSANGVAVVQSGSPLFAREAYWSVAGALEAAFSPQEGLGGRARLVSAHVNVPSFGEWGFHYLIAGAARLEGAAFPDGLKFLDDREWERAQIFGPLTERVPAEANKLQTLPLARYYQEGWEKWMR